ncbi:hypothetical protein TWF730_009903 [Orbilia blumenaviensis]|uniref:CHAT domain-containing protein n=1 Tax=Orbilia blumenaviensis TaxID=1796055 RepID=A0AAV9UTZ8_9PEZI
MAPIRWDSESAAPTTPEQVSDATALSAPSRAPSMLSIPNRPGKLNARIKYDDFLELAITMTREIIICSSAPASTQVILHNMRTLYEMWFEIARHDLDQLDLRVREMVLGIPDDHPSHVYHLSQLFSEKLCLVMSSGDFGQGIELFDRTNLNEGIDRRLEVVSAAGKTLDPQDTDLSVYITDLVHCLRKLYDLLPNDENFEELIHRLMRGLISCIDITSDERAVVKGRRYKTNQDIDHRMDCCDNLIEALCIRFEDAGGFPGRKGNVLSYLDDAISIGDAAIKNMPEHEQRLKSLPRALMLRYEKRGLRKDIDEAIRLERLQLELAESGERSYVHLEGDCLNELANFLALRFERESEFNDINEAVSFSERSVKLGASMRSGVLASWKCDLGKFYGLKYSRTTNLEDLEKGIDQLRDALDELDAANVDSKSPQRLQCQNNLAILLGWRYERSRQRDEGVGSAAQNGRPEVNKDLNEAIRLLWQVALEPNLHNFDTDYIRSLNNLGKFLTWKYKISGDDNDIYLAIVLGSKVKERTDEQSTERARYLSNLADMFRLRHIKKKNDTDGESAIKLLKEIVSLDSTPPTHRISAVLEAISWLEETKNWSDLRKITGAAVRLLPRASARSLRQTDQQDILRRYAGLTSLAAASVLKAGGTPLEAVTLLEEGRGITSISQFDTRTDLIELKAAGGAASKLAEEFELLRDQPEPDESFKSISTSKTSQIPSASRKLDEKMEEIRKLAGFKTFLKPPSENDLKAAAGPKGKIVIINISFRSDAFIIDKNGIELCELGNGSDLRPELDKKIKAFAPHAHGSSGSIFETLEWIWDVIANPILEHLKMNKACDDGNWPTICWVPTGLLCSLPLHAAGYHQDGSRRTVLDCVISSYSLSVKARLYTRQNMAKWGHQTTNRRAVLVSMPKTEEYEDLPGTEPEVTEVKRILRGSGFTCEDGSLDKDGIRAKLSDCDIFHFAGHGITDAVNPSQSGIILNDGSMSVQDLAGMKLHKRNPLLAYLSACSTGHNRDGALQDEGIHLMGACQLAGFRHVIGSMWVVSDERCPMVAQDVYETIVAENLSDESVAKGLHNAIINLRRKTGGSGYRRDRNGDVCYEGGEEEEDLETNGGDPRLWAPYIHVGIS